METKKLDQLKKAVKVEKEDGCHQAILDVGYNAWQNPDNSWWDYKDMVRYMDHTYGDFAAFMVTIGKMNQQVCNGGWSQYFDNRYGDYNTHWAAIRYLKDNCDTMPKKEKLMRLMIEADNENDEYKEYNAQDEDYDFQWNDKLNDDYYLINEEIIKWLEAYAQQVLYGNNDIDLEKQLELMEQLDNPLKAKEPTKAELLQEKLQDEWLDDMKAEQEPVEDEEEE